MKKSKVIAVTGAAVLIGVIGIGSTLAYFTDEETANNVVTIGHVDISLTEPIFSGTYEDNAISDVLPNQTIEKDPTITVEEGSSDCYLRAAVTFVGLTDEQAEQLRESLAFEEDWVLEDGYYYYQNVAAAGDEVKLFTEVTIPAEWGNEMADQTFQINVKAEAIQADNFEPSRTNGVITGWLNEDGNDVTVSSYEVDE
jgi:predicted ribosomally synthesized peptide with SipW-like signal peptide